MRIIFVRHGQTTANLTRTLRIHPGADLTEHGHAQAKLVAERLIHEPVAAIVSSDSPRAVWTAHAIAEKHPGVPRIQDPRFREKAVGEIEGESDDLWRELQKASGEHGFLFSSPGGESGKQVAERGRAAIEELRELYRGKTIVIVAHGWFLQGIVFDLLALSSDEYEKIKHPNASISIVELDDNGTWRAHMIGDVSHLNTM